MTPRLTPETEAEIARVIADHRSVCAIDGWNPSMAERAWVARCAALLAELQAVREERDRAIGDRDGMEMMHGYAIAQRKVAEENARASLAGLDDLRRLSEAATPETWVADRRGVWRERRDGQGRRAKYVVCECHTTAGHEAEQPGNPPFIAAAVTFVRALLAADV